MPRRIFIGVTGLAAATLLLESTFLRLLSVAQFYHFAFLVVSLALLGFGASGSFLAASARLQNTPIDKLLPACGLAFAVSVIAAYGIANFLPFDSFSITWDPRQIVYFVLYFLALALPFIFSGLGIGACLAAAGALIHEIYAANLLGSALGVLLSLAILELGGVPAAVLASVLLAFSAGFAPRFGNWLAAGVGLAALAWLASANLAGQAPLGLNLSPYKGLAYARQYPGAEEVYGAWSAISRVDILKNAGTRQYPGLSYTFSGELPIQAGLSVDGDRVQPISLVEPEQFSPWSALPEGITFSLKPDSETLVLEPGSGFGVLEALAGGANQVTAVVRDPLIVRALQHALPDFNIFRHPRVTLVKKSPRVFLESQHPVFDVVFLPLVDEYRPVTSGAYSLAENYLITVEGIASALDALSPGGVLVATRWLQTPPSESLRLVATIVEAQDDRGLDSVGQLLVAYRGVQTLTVMVKDEPWTSRELEAIRSFLRDRRFDLVWAPDIHPGEVNQYNVLPEPDHYLGVKEIIDPEKRQGFYAGYPYLIRPARDNRPFFFHFFTWQQTPEILKVVGKVWQPFGGSGYFVLLALLILVSLLAAGLIILPLYFQPKRVDRETSVVPFGKILVYFGLLGIGFLFIEIPLIQKWILILGHPTYAFVGVVFILLAFSSLGSRLSRAAWLSGRLPLGWLALLALGMPWVTSRLMETSLGWPTAGRILAAGLGLAPLAFLMGLPFPLGLAWLEKRAPQGIPWAWAVNGCASVIAAVLAALLSLSAGFALVLWIGAAAYTGAWFMSLAFIQTPE